MFLFLAGYLNLNLILTLVLPQREKFSSRHEAILTGIYDHLDAFEELLYTYAMNDRLSHAILDLVSRGFYKATSEEMRQKCGLSMQKAWARKVLGWDSAIEELKSEVREWLIDQGEDPTEVEKLGNKEEDEDEDEDYDWTSTSTLE